MTSTLAFAAAGFAFLGVGLGAFGAHGLASRVSDDRMKTYQTGIQYHLIHAVAAWMAGMFAQQSANAQVIGWAGWLFLCGIVLFSGSLYALALDRLPRSLGVVTPVGGLLFLVGWAFLAVHML